MKQYVQRLSETRPTQIRPDLAGRVFEGDSLTLVRWEFAPGTPRTGLHVQPDHEQMGIVRQGQIEIQIGDDVVQPGPGDVFWCPLNVPHGRTLVLGDTPVLIMDVFNPLREEYVAAATAAQR